MPDKFYGVTTPEDNPIQSIRDNNGTIEIMTADGTWTPLSTSSNDPSQLANDANLDNITTGSTYYGAAGNGCTFSPGNPECTSDMWAYGFTLFIFPSALVHQIVLTNGKLYVRNLYGNEWTDMAEIFVNGRSYIGEKVVAFAAAEERTNIETGNSLETLFGKIKKWFTDLKAVAFSGSYNDLTNKPTALKNPNSLVIKHNNSSWTYDGSSSKTTNTVYGPLTGGTAGYELVATGTTGTPAWMPPPFATCITANNVALKAVTITNLRLATGKHIFVKFTDGSFNTAGNYIMLNVNSDGGKRIGWYGRHLLQNDTINGKAIWSAGDIVEFLYDGNCWQIVAVMPFNNIDWSNGDGRVAHTSGLNDAGEVIDEIGYGYASNEVWTKVLSIPGAAQINVFITSESATTTIDDAMTLEGFGCIWSGSHPEYTAATNYGTSLEGKIGGIKELKQIVVDGDTVTVAWYSGPRSEALAYGLHVSIRERIEVPTALPNPNALTANHNGTSVIYDGSAAKSLPGIWGPTSAGTNGYELVSVGSGAPLWVPPPYGSCNSSNSVYVKVVTLSNFRLTTGKRVFVLFNNSSYYNATSQLTLNVNSTGAKTIYWNGIPVVPKMLDNGHPLWEQGSIVEFVYNGTYWHLVGVVNKDHRNNGTNTIAHTSGLDDSGNIICNTSGYYDYERWNKVLSIPGAKELIVEATYKTEGTGVDYGYIWFGKHLTYNPENTTDRNLAFSGVLGGTTLTTKRWRVDGDSVTVGWRADSSVNRHYGLYVTIHEPLTWDEVKDMTLLLNPETTPNSGSAN